MPFILNANPSSFFRISYRTLVPETENAQNAKAKKGSSEVLSFPPSQPSEPLPPDKNPISSLLPPTRNTTPTLAKDKRGAKNHLSLF